MCVQLDGESVTSVPKALQYLETSCDTNRLVMFIRLLMDIDAAAEDDRCLSSLRAAAESFSLTRVARIITACAARAADDNQTRA